MEWNLRQRIDEDELYCCFQDDSRTKPPRTKPPGQNLPDKTPRTKPPGQNPPDKTPRTKPPGQYPAGQNPPMDKTPPWPKPIGL